MLIQTIWWLYNILWEASISISSDLQHCNFPSKGSHATVVTKYLLKLQFCFCSGPPGYVTMVKRGFEVRQLQATDNHYLHVVYEQTNLFSESGNPALAQGQFYFGPLHGSSGHHTAL